MGDPSTGFMRGVPQAGIANLVKTGSKTSQATCSGERIAEYRDGGYCGGANVSMSKKGW